MGVLLGLGDVELVQAVLGQHLGQHVPRVLGREGHRQRELLLVLGHGDEVDVRRVRAAVEEVEALLEEGARELPGAVGTEVEEQAHVAVLDQLAGSTSARPATGRAEASRR